MSLVRIPKTKRTGTVIENYYPADVEALYGVNPREFIDVKALMGDSSDNIPGVPSIGEKTAAAIISAYHSIENAHAHLDEIKPPRAKKALEEHYDLAELSKALATICLDCELDFTSEDARLGELYTPEAYELCKELEFKSLLTKFDVQEAAAPVEVKVHVLSDLSEAESVFAKATKTVSLGVALEAEDGELRRVALSFEDTDTYVLETEGFLTSEHLKERLGSLIQRVCENVSVQAGTTVNTADSGEQQAKNVADADGFVGFLDVKAACKLLDIPENPAVWDLGIAAYLLNPLKSTYDYDDLARDYLGQTIPSRADLFGKAAGKLTAGERAERVCTALAEEARVCREAQETLKNSLTETEMLSLYLDIEMPLAFSLDRMEKEGIRTAKEELAKYGARLAGQISVLEQSIYEMTGETFNINSPRRVWVRFCLKKCSCPAVRRRRPVTVRLLMS